MKKLNPDFVFPKYKNDCFSNIPTTILDLFGVGIKRPTISKEHYYKYSNGQYDNVILLWIDALGFHQWKRFANQFSLFKLLDGKGYLSPATSVFPSTTVCAMNTINSGLTPAEHGLFEWTLFMQEIDATIEPFPFNKIGEKGISLLEKSVNPKILFSFPTIYQTLKKNGVNSFSFVDKSYANNTFLTISQKGSISLPFVNFSDLVVKLKNQLIKCRGKNYLFAYWDRLDTLGHEYGPDNDAYKVELSKISHLLSTEFIKKLDKQTRQKTLLIITADHGQIAVNPKETIYLDKDEKLMKSLQKNKTGEIILPTGSARDVYLHIEEKWLKEIYQHLKNKLKNGADVVYTDEAIISGLFGQNKVDDKFRSRLGNLMLLPYENYTIWREYKGKKFEFLGHHGGLNKEEMEIPISICSLEEIFNGIRSI